MSPGRMWSAFAPACFTTCEGKFPTRAPSGPGTGTSGPGRAARLAGGGHGAVGVGVASPAVTGERGAETS